MNVTSMIAGLDRHRRRLGMSKTRVAQRAGLSLATVNRLFSGKEGRPSISSLSALAAALGLEVILGARPRIRPIESAASYRERQASRKARRLVGIVRGSMALEAEGIPEDSVREMERETMIELLAGSSRRLWSD